MQQEVCYVHVRLSIALGHAVPNITYRCKSTYLLSGFCLGSGYFAVDGSLPSETILS